MISYSNTEFLLGTTLKNSTDIFNDIKARAREFSRLNNGALMAGGFVEGYDITNTYVLVPAFRSALSGKSVSMKNPTRPNFPLPNWRLTYSGLRNIPFINSQFEKFDIQHAYTSTYTATGIQSNIDYYNNPNALDVRGNKLNPYVFSQAMFVEEFAPFVGADVTMRNHMQFRAHYNRNRMFLLGLVNQTLTEDSGSEYVLGFGYILKDLKLKLRYKGKTRDIKSDLNIRADFSLRDNKTSIINILKDDAQVTGGQRLLGIKVSADYNMSQNFNIRFFYDQLMTKYKISTAFPLSTVRAGLSATFTFGGNGM